MAQLTRPAVSVIVPFYGTGAEASETVARFGALLLREGDEVLIADNTPGGVVAAVAQDTPGVRVVEAWQRTSPYSARNRASLEATAPWLAFCDGDVEPRPDLLDAYFAEPLPEDCGMVAGRIADAPGQPGLVPAYVRARGHYDQSRHVQHPFGPVVLTANMLVRRDAFEQAGGFCDGVRSGADSDLSWRVHQDGWAVVHRAEPWVVHRHRDSVGAIARQAARDGAGKAWLERRHPGSAVYPGARGLLRSLAGALLLFLTVRPRRAAFKAIDAVAIVSERLGALADNAAPGRAASPSPAVLVAGEYPSPEVDGILAGLPDGARVEADVRPRSPGLRAAATATAHLEEDGVLHRHLAFAWMAATRPLRTARLARRAGVARAWAIAPRVRRLARLGERGVVAVDAGGAAELTLLLGCRADDPDPGAVAQSTSVR